MGKYAIAVKVAIAVSTLAAMGLFGVRAKQRTNEDAWPTVGQWHVAGGRSDDGEPRAAGDDMSRLLALGYVEGSKDAPAMSGVTRNTTEAGANLYVSGHASEAYLIATDGTLLHTWSYPREKAFPKLHDFAAKADADRLYWRWAHPRDDGSIVAVYEGAGIVALDKNSRPLWSFQGFNHHDVDSDPDGNVYALGRKRRVVSSIRPEPIIDDIIQVIDRNGGLTREISMLDALPAELLQRIPRAQTKLVDGSIGDDVLHTNAVRFLDGTQTAKWPEFQKGRVLVSIRELDALAVIDLASAKAVWTSTGVFKRQHAPELQPDGRLLVFDNIGAGTRSRILALEPNRPPTLLFDGGLSPFYSKTCGAVQKLANGNLLIAETETGRAIETNAKGEIVWEFWNPHRAGPKDKYIAALFEMKRVPESFVRAATGQ